MMPYILMHLGLFDGENRAESEDTILWLLEVLVDRNCRYLEAHPDTPKLYESGVVYAVPDQMAECRIDASRLAECRRFLKKIGASPDTVEAVLAFLRGVEVFRDIPTILQKRTVDCDNLSAYRCAELRMAGVKASPYITWRETGAGTTYHALVRWPDGTSEDPSLLLGMGGDARAVARAEEQRKNRERYDNLVAVAQALCASGAAAPAAVGPQIDALGLIPRGGW